MILLQVKIKYLICHMTSQKKVIKESYNFMSGNFSWYVTALPSLVAIVVEIVQIFSVCHLRYNSFSLSDDLAGLINWSL